MERYELRIRPDRVEALKRKAQEWSQDLGFALSWNDLARHGIELILNDDKAPPMVGGVKRMNMETV